MSSSRTRAFHVVRAAVRMKLLVQRLRDIDPDIPEVDPDALHNMSESDIMKISLAKGFLGSSRRETSLSQELQPLLTPKGKQTSLLSKDMQAVSAIIGASWINALLLVVPFAILAGIMGWGDITVFTLNFLALVPLSLILGDITEDLALRFGDVVGGLLNATFGNVIEIIISIAALQRDLFTVVATSLVGSILSNLLLVLGCSFFFGGLYFKNQSYNPVSNRASCSLLVLATIGVFIPTLAANIIPDSGSFILPLSRGCAIVLLFTYACFIYFHLYTHPHTEDEQGEEERTDGGAEVAKELEMPMLTTFTALFILGVITVIVAVHSEYLTGALEEVSKQTGLGQAFLGMIVLPIAGNACEHLTAVMVAMKNKMDLSLGIAVGSSLQIALFAIPVAVLAGWVTGHDFSLNFDFFSVIILLLSVVQTSVATSDANSHWLQGITLVVVYVLIALTYFFRA